MRRLYVYIMASDSRQLYVGVTNNLSLRVQTHRLDLSEYTARHQIHHLVYYEHLGPPIVAITREKQIKGWKRIRRLELVESTNPDWKDLAPK